LIREANESSWFAGAVRAECFPDRRCSAAWIQWHFAMVWSFNNLDCVASTSTIRRCIRDSRSSTYVDPKALLALVVFIPVAILDWLGGSPVSKFGEKG
jgi:hypothetical protein